MTNFFFHNADGKILMTGCCAESDISLQKFSGGVLVVGEADCYQNYYSGGEVVEFPEKPSEFHAWDWSAHTWNQDRALAEKLVRAKRDGLLRNVIDAINAVRWAVMDHAERAEWDTYRTALLDITDQPGFPFETTWPTAPNNKGETV